MAEQPKPQNPAPTTSPPADEAEKRVQEKFDQVCEAQGRLNYAQDELMAALRIWTEQADAAKAKK